MMWVRARRARSRAQCGHVTDLGGSFASLTLQIEHEFFDSVERHRISSASWRTTIPEAARAPRRRDPVPIVPDSCQRILRARRSRMSSSSPATSMFGSCGCSSPISLASTRTSRCRRRSSRRRCPATSCSMARRSRVSYGSRSPTCCCHRICRRFRYSPGAIPRTGFVESSATSTDRTASRSLVTHAVF